MKLKIKRLTPKLFVALLTFIIGVGVALLWVALHFRSLRTPSVLEVPNSTKIEEVSSPEGWRTLVVEGKVTLQVPPDMRPSELIGDSLSHREAYSNRDINITIIYGEPDPCDTPRHLLERPTYHESIVDIGGRNALIGIDRYYQPKAIITSVCLLNTDDSVMQLRALVFCKDDRALETAQTIFKSIRFKDFR